MAADQVIRRDWDAETTQLMRPSAQASPWVLVEGLNDNLGSSHLYEIRRGEQHALVALRGLDMEGGRLLEVVGLRSLGARITPDGVAAITQLAREVYAPDLLSMCTRHAHLARTCVRAGWSDVAHIVNIHLRTMQ